ncbi:hypothetical protein IFR04_005738 [Cadophora malorum]|uniref:CDP-alcohol phosphatidyltransferase n=1 Tax=Cadophora malorum TaxID=108018 RepID=A0A8H7TG96_9HELO|nr:hypothetical protein IFR04_005738 [Cadophora malorum]
MYDNYLRHVKDWSGTPLCRILPTAITPNQVTLAAFISGLLAVGTAAHPTSSSTHWPLLFWLSNRFLDGADGTLARMRGTASALGGFLDLLGDFIIYSLIPIMLAYGQEATGYDVDWRAVALLEATFHINNFVLFYISAVVAAKPDDELTSVSMRPALIEGLESGLLFTAMFVSPQHLMTLCWMMSGAVVVGIGQRLYFIIPSLKGLDHRVRNRKRQDRFNLKL